MIDWYEYALNNIEISLTTGKLTTKRKLKRGTPQVGILSPLAFDIAFDPVLQLIEKFNQGVATPFG